MGASAANPSFVDIHSHILHSLDDGPEDLATSREILHLAFESGTTDMVATPHSDLLYRFDPEQVSARIEELNALPGPKPRIHRGCDFHMHFDNIRDCLAHPEKYTINHLRYLMVEFSHLAIPKTTSQIFGQMLEAGITPVITHPERNPLLMKDLPQLIRWINDGMLVQVTADSFLGRFGKQAEHAAAELMSRSMVHFVASDTHDPAKRPPDLRPAYEHVTAKYGESTACSLFHDHPAATLTGEAFRVEYPDPAPTRKWFQFW